MRGEDREAHSGDSSERQRRRDGKQVERQRAHDRHLSERATAKERVDASLCARGAFDTKCANEMTL